MRGAAAVLALAAVWPGAALADDDPACARFAEPLAYNACLASRGPKANAVGKASASPQGAPARDPDAGAPVQAARPSRELPGVVHRRGRIHMEFRLR